MTKCFLVIVPFVSKCEADRPEFRRYERNLSEVDEEYYDKILADYQKWKNKQKLSAELKENK